MSQHIQVVGWPHCVICNKPVDKIESSTDLQLSVYIVRAFCHGDVDEVRLTQTTMERMRGVEFTQAFQTKKIK